MSTLRTAVAAHLAGALDATWRVTGHARSIDRIDPGRHVLMLTTARWAHPTDALSLVPVTLHLWIVTGATDPDVVEDDLDTALTDVLDALHTLFRSHST